MISSCHLVPFVDILSVSSRTPSEALQTQVQPPCQGAHSRCVQDNGKHDQNCQVKNSLEQVATLQRHAQCFD
jgi:hypothetical protein